MTEPYPGAALPVPYEERAASTRPAPPAAAAPPRPVPPKAKKGGKKGRRPADHRAPQERRAAAKRRLPATVELEYHGRTFVVSRAAAEDVELFEKIEDGHYVTAVRGFIGPEQWALFKEDHRVDGRVPMSSLEGFLQELVNLIQGAAKPGAEGGAPGNS